MISISKENPSFRVREIGQRERRSQRQEVFQREEQKQRGQEREVGWRGPFEVISRESGISAERVVRERRSFRQRERERERDREREREREIIARAVVWRK